MDENLKRKTGSGVSLTTLIILVLLAGGVILYNQGKLGQLLGTDLSLPSGAPITGLNSITNPLDPQNNSGQSGIVSFFEDNGQTKVVINLAGEPDNGIQPAHIHVGTCPNPGAIVYSLSDVVDGQSETTLNTTLNQLRSMLPLAVNVHESAQNLQNYTACGDVRF